MGVPDGMYGRTGGLVNDERAVAWLAAVAAMPRWRRWLWSRLPASRLTYPLIELLAPEGGDTDGA